MGDKQQLNVGRVVGKDGESAYELAVSYGFEGTEQEWLDSLKGASGSLDTNFGNGLLYNEDTDTLSVDTVDDAYEDNTKPITSGAVYREIGNIDALLESI